MKNWSWYLQLAGLLVGFAAALSLAVSQKPGKGIAQATPDGGEAEYLVLRYPWLWTSGLVLFVFGFCLQLVSLFCQP